MSPSKVLPDNQLNINLMLDHVMYSPMIEPAFDLSGEGLTPTG